jgi:hypothetical protein
MSVLIRQVCYYIASNGFVGKHYCDVEVRNRSPK